MVSAICAYKSSSAAVVLKFADKPRTAVCYLTIVLKSSSVEIKDLIEKKLTLVLSAIFVPTQVPLIRTQVPLIRTHAPFTLYRIAIAAPQLSYRTGVLSTSHQSYPIHDALRIGAKITSLRRLYENHSGIVLV